MKKSSGLKQKVENELKRMERDLAAIETKLGDKAFLFGGVATAADATVAPVLDMILQLPAPTGLRQAAEARHVFAPYAARVRAAIYPPMQRFSTGVSAAAE